MNALHSFLYGRNDEDWSTFPSRGNPDVEHKQSKAFLRTFCS